MRGLAKRRRGAGIAACLALLAAQGALAQAAAPQGAAQAAPQGGAREGAQGGANGGVGPATAPAEAGRAGPAATAPARFAKGDSINVLLGAIAARYGVIVVQAKPVDAQILSAGELPGTMDAAIDLAQQLLEQQGYGIIRKVTAKPNPHVLLRIVTAQEAKRALVEESPVTSGTDAQKIDVSEPGRQVTHLLPVSHAEVINNLQRAATQDKDVSADVLGTEAQGLTLVFTGPAEKVKKAVAAVAALDKGSDREVVVRTIQLKNQDAVAAANSLNGTYGGAKLGEGAPFRAIAEPRTNTVVISGSAVEVVEALSLLARTDAAAGPKVPGPRPEIPDRLLRGSDTPPPTVIPERVTPGRGGDGGRAPSGGAGEAVPGPGSRMEKKGEALPGWSLDEKQLAGDNAPLSFKKKQTAAATL